LVFMKRKALALTLISALLTSTIAGTKLSLLAKANPAPLFYPREPTIDIISPTNRTYSLHSLSLNVAIKTFNSYQEGYQTNVHRSVSYSLDGVFPQVMDDTLQREVPPGYTVGEYTTFFTSVFLSGLRDGSHNITVHAQYDYTARYDTSTYWHFESVSSVFFRVDSFAPPFISVLSPENKTYNIRDIPLNFTVDKSTSWMGYSLDGKNITIAGNTTLASLPNGIHCVTVYANDSFGRMGMQAVNFTAAVAPVVSFLSYENRTFETSTFPLNFTVEQSVSKIMYCLDGQANVTTSGNVTITGLSNGEHNVTVYAMDKLGYVGVSETVYFTVAVPFPTALAIASVAGVAVGAVDLLVYFRKRTRGSL
jgi:hypothetical protein